MVLEMVFKDQEERGPDYDSKPQFERVCQFDPDENMLVKALLEGLILIHEAKQLANISQ